MKMDFRDMLGRYTKAETAFLKESNGKTNNRSGSFYIEDRGGLMSVGKEMEDRYSFLPSVEKMREYRKLSIEGIRGSYE